MYEFKQWAKTPPKGWNSWDSYGASVTEKEVRQNADYMAKHLKGFGWDLCGCRYSSGMNRLADPSRYHALCRS
ncbi:MAG: hypothetical protein U5K84_10630 [Alkalibacterium sp.]|nr:hypothetical protein [Alkalibacterium sp.]